MCYLCDGYGDGGIWYFNPKNYARNMYSLRTPGQERKKATTLSEQAASSGPTLEDLVVASEKGDLQEYDRIRKSIADGVRRVGHEGQVVPLKDADRVLELCSPLALISCMCRRTRRATDERNEHDYTCLGMGVGMLKWERWPERYKGGAKFLTIEEAKEWNHRLDKKGFVHILMLYGTPYIGGFCQCDFPDCNLIRESVDFGIASLLKSHYVAQVDYDVCNGCGICAQRCQFGALKFEVTSRKANVDQFKCYGCGLCETGCPRKAIALMERKSLPALADVWSGGGMGAISTKPLPRLSIDHSKCTVPFLCKKCLQACPEAVFEVWRVAEKEERLKEMDPRVDGNYVLSAPRRDKCTVCNKCIQVCPVDAIKIEVPVR